MRLKRITRMLKSLKPKVGHMELLSEDIKRKKPEKWKMAYDWASHPSLEEHKWRWEFVRRSKIFQRECQAIRESIGPFLLPESFGSYDPDRLPRFFELFDCMDTIMEPLCRAWGLSTEGLLDHQRYLICDYEADFPTLLTALVVTSSFINDIDWKARSRLIAEQLSDDYVQIIHPAIKFHYKVSEAQYPPPQGTNIFYRDYLLLKVAPAEGKDIRIFLEHLSKDIPANCFEISVRNDTAFISVIPQYIEITPKIKIPDFSKLNHIKEAVEKAYGKVLPTVIPWDDRKKTEFYPKQILALDVDSGMISKDEAGFVKDKNFSRILKNAKSKIEALEKNAKIRREIAQNFSPFLYDGPSGKIAPGLKDGMPSFKITTPKTY